nr:MAG TPA: hypothetical protein [Caudoviricetes sp.]
MPFGQIAGQPIPFIARLSPFLPSGCFPCYTSAFPTP